MGLERDVAADVRATARKFAARHIAPVAADVDHAERPFSEAVFQAGLDAGFGRFVLAEPSGGDGFEFGALVALIEELARCCAGHAMTFGIHAAVLHALEQTLGESAQSFVPRLASARLPLGAALSVGLNRDEVAVDASLSDDEGEVVCLGDRAPLVVNAFATASTLLVARSGVDHRVALLLEGGGAPRTTEPEPTLGLRAMPLARLALPAPVAAPSSVLAVGEAARRLFDAQVSRLCLVVAAAASGVMADAHDRALRYAAERYQGGRIIIDHSHLRDILGAMSARVQACASLVRHAAQSPEDWRLAVATKRMATEQAVRTCTDAVQLLGGYGYMREYGLEKAMRDAATLSLLPLSNIHAQLWLAAADKATLAGGQRGPDVEQR